jgi:hypothetical protein
MSVASSLSTTSTLSPISRSLAITPTASPRRDYRAVYPSPPPPPPTLSGPAQSMSLFAATSPTPQSPKSAPPAPPTPRLVCFFRVAPSQLPPPRYPPPPNPSLPLTCPARRGDPLLPNARPPPFRHRLASPRRADEARPPRPLDPSPSPVVSPSASLPYLRSLFKDDRNEQKLKFPLSLSDVYAAKRSVMKFHQGWVPPCSPPMAAPFRMVRPPSPPTF